LSIIKTPLHYVWATLLVLGVTVAGLVARTLTPTNMVMIYLLVVVMIASRWGKLPAVWGALLSVFSYDFFFVPPYRLLTFTDLSEGRSEHLVTFCCFLVVGLLVAHLTDRVRTLAEDRLHLMEDAKNAEILGEKERLQAALLSSISHDLQTPIFSIVGALDSLCDKDIQLDDDSRQAMIDTARLETHRLQRLVRNLLDLTRLESGPKLKLAFCDPTDLLGTALGQLDETLGGRTIRLHSDADGQPLRVDFVLFTQVLVNLIDNANKYSPPETPIDVAFEACDSHWRVEVRDQGGGIPEADREKVFEKFFRRSDTKTTGSGLGLAISRGLVEAHGGTLVARPAPGGGTVMVIELPQEALV
jgi:two-component system sensor histidine kinase KdpD